MSAKVFGLSPLEIVPQGDFNAERGENGGWTASQSYKVLGDTTGINIIDSHFPAEKRASELDATLGALGNLLYLDTAAVTSRKGGIATVRASFLGYSEFEADFDDPQVTRPTYRLRGSLREAPIEEHPSVVALGDEDREIIADCIKGVYAWDYTASSGSELAVPWQDDDGQRYLATAARQPSASPSLAITFVHKALQGVTTYTRPTYFWEKTWESETPLSAAQLNKLGKVDTPDGDPPEAGGTRDWMLVDADMQKRGKLYRNFLSWEMSEAGGWDEEVYDY